LVSAVVVDESLEVFHLAGELRKMKSEY
jgi:hypothetical protein